MSKTLQGHRVSRDYGKQKSTANT